MEFTGFCRVWFGVGSRRHYPIGGALRNFCKLGCWALCQLLWIAGDFKTWMLAWGRVFEVFKELKKL